MKSGRKINKDEKRLLSFLINNSIVSIADNWDEEILVVPMADDGMGSLTLVPKPELLSVERKFGKQVSEYRFFDIDGTEVIASLNLDSNGNLFELDIWKTDFSPLIKIPDNIGD